MTDRKRFLAIAIAAATLTASVGVVSANHIRIEAPVPATSLMKRVQREHRMQRVE